MTSTTLDPSDVTSTNRKGHQSGIGDVRTGLGAEAIAEAIVDNLRERYLTTADAIASSNTPATVVAYLSAEFLTGPHLGNSLLC